MVSERNCTTSTLRSAPNDFLDADFLVSRGGHGCGKVGEVNGGHNDQQHGNYRKKSDIFDRAVHPKSSRGACLAKVAGKKQLLHQENAAS